MWQRGYMFRLSPSHLQALMIQIHTIVGFTTDIVSIGDPTRHSTFFVWIRIMRA